MADTINNIAESYSQLLNTISNYQERSNRFLKSLAHFYEEMINGRYVPPDFLDKKDYYPKYPYLYPVIDRLAPFNQMKIFYSSSDDVEYLLDTFDDTLLALKNKYDKIPETNVLIDSFLQNSYFSDVLVDIFPKSFFLDFYKTSEYGNYVFDTFNNNVLTTAINNAISDPYLYYPNQILNSEFTNGVNHWTPITDTIASGINIIEEKLLSSGGNNVFSLKLEVSTSGNSQVTQHINPKSGKASKVKVNVFIPSTTHTNEYPLNTGTVMSAGLTVVDDVSSITLGNITTTTTDQWVSLELSITPPEPENLRIQLNYQSNAVGDVAYFDKVQFVYTHEEDITTPTEETMENTSCQFLISLFTTLLKTIPTGTNIQTSVMNYIITTDTIDNTMLADSFDTFIDNNIEEFGREFIEFVLRYCYQITNFSPVFVRRIYKELKSSLLTIKDIFRTFIENKDPLIYSIVDSVIKGIYVRSSLDCMIDIFKDSNFGGFIDISIPTLPGDPTAIDTLQEVEEEKYRFIMTPEVDQGNLSFFEIPETTYKSYSTQTIKKYLFLNYYYKFWPKKFLNLLQLLCKEYVQTYLRTEADLITNQGEVSSALGDMNRRIKFDVLAPYLEGKISASYFKNIVTEYKIVEFMSQTQICNAVDEFLNYDDNSDINTYIDDIFEKIYDYLKDSGQIEYTKDYFKYRNMIHLFLKTFFRKNVFGAVVFNNYLEELVDQVKLGIDDMDTPDYDVDTMDVVSTQAITNSLENEHQFIENLFTTAVTKKILIDNLTYYLV